MNCKDCKHAIVGKDEQDRVMYKLGYKTCSKARTEEERAKYIRGVQSCLWPERLK